MSTVNAHNLPDDLRAIQLETEAHARAYGLDFYDTIFEVLDYDELSEIAALGGFPLAILTGGSAWSISSLPRAIGTDCRRSTRWSSTTTRATPTCCAATRWSTRSS